MASIAIDNDWSGIRFRHKNATKSLKRLPPIEARNTEGIDYINRIVKLPKDAVAMMQPHKELENFFYSMAFTHKKEYVAAIEDAKKPETRHRRIEKMIEMLLKLKAQKETKAKHK